MGLVADALRERGLVQEDPFDLDVAVDEIHATVAVQVGQVDDLGPVVGDRLTRAR